MRRLGIWVSNGRPTDVELMLSWNPGALTCFQDYAGPNRIREYKMTHPECQVILRFQHPHNWQENITESATNHARELLSKWPEIREFTDYVYFGNETNLWYESGGNSVQQQGMFETPEFYKSFAEWTRIVSDRVKQAEPTYPIVCPSFAFGHGEDGAPDDNGNPKAGWAGYDYLADTIRTHFDNILTFHAYWGHSGGSVRNWLYDPEMSSWYAFRWRRLLKMFSVRYGIQARLIIDEAGNMAASDQDFTDQLLYFAEQSLSDPRVIAVTPFLWEDPTFSAGNMPNSWVQRIRNLSEHIRRVGEFSVDAVSPPAQVDTMIRLLMPDGNVQQIAMEEYLRAVVPSEVPAGSWQMATLEAQTVAARTYAKYAVQHPRHSPNADLCTTQHCQVYNPARIHPRTDAAIAATRGVVMLYDNHVINAFFSANCGGSTISNADAWGGDPLPYLLPVDCPAHGPKNGHRVGMCQHGAEAMAIAGTAYREILKHYYSGITFSDSNVVPPETPVDTDPGDTEPGGSDMAGFNYREWITKFKNSTTKPYNDATGLGVVVKEVSVADGTKHANLVGVHVLTAAENGGFPGMSAAFLTVVDENWNIVETQPLPAILYEWKGMGVPETPAPVYLDKIGEDMPKDVWINPRMASMKFSVAGMPSDAVDGISTQHPDQNDLHTGHFSFYMCWMITTVPETPDTPPDTPPVEPPSSDELSAILASAQTLYNNIQEWLAAYKRDVIDPLAELVEEE